MCFSTEASLTAWLTSVVIALYLYKRNRNYDRWNAVFILTFSSVQLWEAGIWSGFGNQVVYTQLLLLSLLAQPLVQTGMGYKYTGSKILQYLTYLYLAIFLHGVYRVFTEKFSTSVGANGHLVWSSSGDNKNFIGNWFVGIAYMIGIFFALLYVLPSSLALIAIGVLTLLYSIYKTKDSGEMGSLWCFTAVIYSIACLFI